MTSSIKEYFIRPHRQIYYPFDLGPTQLNVLGRKCTRKDFSIPNNRDDKLAVSFYQGSEDGIQNCLLYLHTHNGSKLEAIPMVESIMSIGINFCIFDFAGYGNSEGQTVSLGLRQIWDIDCVISYLHNTFNQHKFILWGRSMGAVAALLYLSSRIALKEEEHVKMSSMVVGGIYDSPFESLQKLTLQIACRTSKLPEFMVSPLVYLIKQTLKAQIPFQALELTQKMQDIKIPGIFLTSQQDQFVHYSHVENLYREYGGKKELIYIEKDHNQVRKDEDLGPVFQFIRHLHQEHPKRWETVLANNLSFRQKHGSTIFSLYSQSHHR